MENTDKKKTIWQAVGWAALWSTAFIRLIDTWPDFNSTLIKPILFAAILTLIICLYRQLKGYKRNIWLDPLAWITASITLLLIALPSLLRKSTDISHNKVSAESRMCVLPNCACKKQGVAVLTATSGRIRSHGNILGVMKDGNFHDTTEPIR